MIFRIILFCSIVAFINVGCSRHGGDVANFETYYNLGIQSEATGNYDLAVSYFEEAIRLAGRRQLANRANAYNHIGQIALRQGRYNIAMEYFPKALNIRIQLNDREGRASSYRNIGAAYQMGGYFEQAQKHYNNSMNLYASLNNDIGRAECLNNLGGLRIAQNRPQEALEYYLESEKIFNIAGNKNQLWNIFYNIGSTFQLMNEIEQAQEYYSKMLQLSQELNSPSTLAETYRIMGNFYDFIQQSDSAVYYYGKAIEIAHLNGLFSVLYIALEERGRLHAIAGRYREAYTDMRAYNFAYDEVHNREMIRAFTQRRMQFEFDMQQQEQLFRNRIQRIVIIGLSIIAFLVGMVGVVQYRAYLQKKNDNSLLEKQKEEITDSIRYAGMIQKATLPSKEYLDSALPEHFIYYKPRDIVSGDFYWIDSRNDCIIVAVADCTGHGVPGAIVSMLGITTLTKIAGKMETPKADEILNELREEIIRLLNPVGSADKRQDGMDIALAIIHTGSREIEFAGAYNPLYLISDGQLIEKKANRMPVGLYVKQNEAFTADRFNYKSGDTIYMFSDGYADQFGGDDGVKFKTKKLKSLLFSANEQSMEEQARIIDETHRQWKGAHRQLDDILVIGIRLR